MTYQVRTNYSRGYVVEILDTGDERCESWLLVPAENLWSPVLRGFLYVFAIGFFFLGIAIASDIFMSAIETITSKKRTIVTWNKEKNEKAEKEVLIWNETVANLTLMALGSSAPEILLATIETIMSLGKDTSNEDSLGVFTIIGSAAFNLLIITAICIVSITNTKYIREFGVFIMTAFFSIWAYIWMLIVVKYWTPDIITPVEGWITLLHMPLFVFLAYCQDNGWWCKKSKVDQGEEDDHLRILNQRGRAGSFTGHILPKELRVLEAEKLERQSHAKLSIIELNSDYKHYKRVLNSQSEPLGLAGGGSESFSCTTTNLTVIMNNAYQRDVKDSESAIVEMSSTVSLPRDHAEKLPEPRAFARASTQLKADAQFRHAVVATLRGTHPKQKQRRMSDVVDLQMKLKKLEKEGKKPEGDLMGKFTFSSDRYSVLESAGFLELDVLYHRNIPVSDSKSTVTNGDAVSYSKNGSVKINPEPQQQDVVREVTVEYETREGTAKTGKDFRYVCDKLVFKENEYKKTISIPIVNDNQFENDVMFYILLKNPTGGSGLGDPSVATVTIVDDDDPGEFQFDQDHCIADLSEWKVTTKVVREKGFDGKVSIEYATIDGTAAGGKDFMSKVDYISQKGVLEFGHAETTKVITIDVNKDAKLIDKHDRHYQGPKNFIITLKNPSLGAKIGTRSAIVCNITKDDLGDRIREVVEGSEEEATWGAQFVSAMTVGGGTDEDGNEVPPSWLDYVMHFLTFIWKIIGACCPPTSYWGAWPTFICSLIFIFGLTMVVEQLGHLIGCVIGLKTSVTGITIIALGTSLPDTFASRTAAKQDEYADAAIGNVTGSNSVNVFLGLGIPWVLSTMYHLAKGTTYRVASDNLTQSVIIFSVIGTICIAMLCIRRKVVGGELGGKNPYLRWGSSIALFLLWIIYLVLASLKAYDILKWEM